MGHYSTVDKWVELFSETRNQREGTQEKGGAKKSVGEWAPWCLSMTFTQPTQL